MSTARPPALLPTVLAAKPLSALSAEAEYMDFHVRGDTHTVFIDCIPVPVPLPAIETWARRFGPIGHVREIQSNTPGGEGVWYAAFLRFYSTRAAHRAAKGFHNAAPWLLDPPHPTTTTGRGAAGTTDDAAAAFAASAPAGASRYAALVAQLPSDLPPMRAWVGRKREEFARGNELLAFSDAVEVLNSYAPLMWSNSIQIGQANRCCKEREKGKAANLAERFALPAVVEDEAAVPPPPSDSFLNAPVAPARPAAIVLGSASASASRPAAQPPPSAEALPTHAYTALAVALPSSFQPLFDVRTGAVAEDEVLFPGLRSTARAAAPAAALPDRGAAEAADGNGGFFFAVDENGNDIVEDETGDNDDDDESAYVVHAHDVNPSAAVPPHILARQEAIYASMCSAAGEPLPTLDSIAASLHMDAVLPQTADKPFPVVSFPFRLAFTGPHPKRPGMRTRPCVFMKQALTFHNSDGSESVSVAASGCTCRHRDDGAADPELHVRAPGAGAAERANDEDWGGRAREEEEEGEGEGEGVQRPAAAPAAARPPPRAVAPVVARPGLHAHLLEIDVPAEVVNAPMTFSQLYPEDHGGASSGAPAAGASAPAQQRKAKRRWTDDDISNGTPMKAAATDAMRAALARVLLRVPARPGPPPFAKAPRAGAGAGAGREGGGGAAGGV
jgi:hypothetical protein